MRAVEELLALLSSLDIKLWVEGDHLRYNAPKGALTPELRARLRERKAEIIAFLGPDNHTSSFDLNPISRNGDIPLSFTQERFWLHQTSNPTLRYNVTSCFRLTGKLDVAALRQSFNEIIRRHEILRTTFPVVNVAPVQAIAPHSSTASMSIVDLQSLPEEEQSDEVESLVKKEVQRPFDLANGPLQRVMLIQLDPESHILLICIHHIILDAWSLGILFKELSILYAAFVSGQPSPLPALPIQYADYAYWQRQSLTPEVLEANLNYWRQWLAKEPPLLELPTDRPRPSVEVFSGSIEGCQFPSDLTQKLKILSQQAGTTLFTTILAAWVTLLYHYSGCEDIVVGAPFTHRNHWKLKPLIGHFGRMLVLRIDMGGKPDFLELLTQVRQVVLTAIANQDVPFEQLAKTLQPERKRSNLLYRQFINFFSVLPATQLKLAGLMVTPQMKKETSLKPDLCLMIGEDKSSSQTSLQGWWVYKRELFDVETVIRLGEDFQAISEAIVTNPEQSLYELPLSHPVKREA